MPLPPALLQRLAKRGLVENHKPAPSEEIIAEDYDDDAPPDVQVRRSSNRRRHPEDDPIEPYPYDYEPAKKPQENFWKERMKRRMADASLTSGYKACPNKYNVYHKCSLFCMNAYGDGLLEPGRAYAKRQERLLTRYPLPPFWKAVWDVGCGVHYYWNTKNDTVAWLPPTHPKANIGRAAAALRRELESANALETDPDQQINAADQNMTVPGKDTMQIALPAKHEASATLSIPLPGPEPPVAVRPAMPVRKPKPRDLDKAIRSQRGRRARPNPNEGKLDPMDPAAYSDIARGKWSAGLERETEKAEPQPIERGSESAGED